jgi:hypothetical protein
MSELERIAVLAEKVEQLEKRDAEDRDELRKLKDAGLTERVDHLERRGGEDRDQIGKLKDAVGSLRNFQAWIMAGIAIVGAVLGKALDPIIDKVFK